MASCAEQIEFEFLLISVGTIHVNAVDGLTSGTIKFTLEVSGKAIENFALGQRGWDVVSFSRDVFEFNGELGGD